MLWSYAVANSVIALAYFAIPLTLLHIYLKRRDFSYIWIMIPFAVFITRCGITHVFDVINIWNPLYQLDVISRIITALASVFKLSYRIPGHVRMSKTPRDSVFIGKKAPLQIV